MHYGWQGRGPRAHGHGTSALARPPAAQLCREGGGEGLTNTINRAELAEILAALSLGYTHIATDQMRFAHDPLGQIERDRCH